MSLRLAALFLSGTALFATSLPAGAIEPEAAAQALAAALTNSDRAEVTFDSASDDGGDVVVSGLTITRASDEEDTVTFAETVIEAPTEGGEGVFDSPSITFTDGTLAGESRGTIGSAVLTDVTVLEPAAEGEESKQSVIFTTLEATDLSFAQSDQKGDITVGRIYMETGNVVDNVPQDNKGSVEDLLVPPEMYAEGDFQPSMIGYDQLVFDVTWDGSRDPSADTMTVRDFTLNMQDGGSLSITGVVGKVPEPTSLNDADAAAQASEMEVHNVTIRYEDSSLTGRVLDFLAKQQGITQAEYAQQIAGALPFLLAALNNPEFQNEVAGAVGAFLQDPQSITISIAPDAPVSGAEIMGLAGTAPQTLPDRLNASVTANSAE
jgi:hypothetical protein